MPYRFHLAELLIWSCVAAVWLWFTLTVGSSNGFGAFPRGYVITPVVLMGMTLAIQRLVRRGSIGLAISALAAPVIATFILLVVATLHRRELL